MTRNPKKVFVGMIMNGSMRWETSQFWETLRFAKVEGYEFRTTRIGGYGQAKARNVVTHLARATDCGILVNLDSDIDPSMDMLLRLLSNPEKMVSGMYPKKTMDKLEWVGNAVGTPARPDGLIEAFDFGGGFCKVDLELIDQICEAHPERGYESEDPETLGQTVFDLWGNGVVVDMWKGRVYPRYLTEDFYLCYLARKLGTACWLDTLCQVGHIGSIDFLKLHMRIKELENQSIFRAPAG